MVGKVLPDVLLTHWPLMSNLVALILTLGSIAVVAVAMMPPNFGSRRGGCGRLPFHSAGHELIAEETSYTSGGEGAIEHPANF
jgi:hypothetical protein